MGSPTSLAADVGHLDARELRRPFGADLRVAVGALCPHAGDGVAELLVARARAEQGPQIGAADREQTRVELPLGRDARPCAVATEGLCDGGDDPDLARPVAVAPAPSDLAP